MFVNAGQRLALLQGGADDAEIEKAIPTSKWTRGDHGDAFLPLSELHDALGSAGVPFLLLVDGCMESKVARARLAEGGFAYDPMRPGAMVYQGPKELLGPDDFRAITGMQADFGRTEPFLYDTNPICFAAKPGTFAVARDNPFVVGGPPVAPLAENLHHWTELFMLRENALPTLKTLLDRVVGFRGVGEIGMEAGISWSDFKKLDAITARLSPEGYVSSADAANAIVERLVPNLGMIEDFTRDPASGTWTLQIKTVEPNGRNRWDIWQVISSIPGQASSSKRTVADIVFPKITCCAGALYLYSDQTRELFRQPIGAKTKTNLKRDLTFTELAPGFDTNSVLALEADNMLGRGGDKLWRFKGSKPDVILNAELSQAKCVVEYAIDRFAWLNSETPGEMQFSDKGAEPRDVRICAEELGGLTFTREGWVAINLPRTRIYRLPPDGMVEAAWLLDAEDHPIVKYHFGYGGVRSFGAETWFASDQSLLRIDLNLLHWQQVNALK